MRQAKNKHTTHISTNVYKKYMIYNIYAYGGVYFVSVDYNMKGRKTEPTLWPPWALMGPGP